MATWKIDYIRFLVLFVKCDADVLNRNNNMVNKIRRHDETLKEGEGLKNKHPCFLRQKFFRERSTVQISIK